jgi:hypothetical protein
MAPNWRLSGRTGQGTTRFLANMKKRERLACIRAAQPHEAADGTTLPGVGLQRCARRGGGRQRLLALDEAWRFFAQSKNVWRRGCA